MPETRFSYQPLPHDTAELNDSLRRLALAHDALVNRVDEFIEFSLGFFSFAAYGGMYMANDTAFADLGAAYQDITLFDAYPLPARGLTFDLVTGRFTFEYPGIYLMNIGFVFRHNELNAGRETYIQLYNHTDGTGAPVVIGTARNVGSSQLSAGYLVQITEDAVGDEFGLQIGGGDIYSSVVFDAARVDACAVGPWEGDA